MRAKAEPRWTWNGVVDTGYGSGKPERTVLLLAGQGLLRLARQVGPCVFTELAPRLVAIRGRLDQPDVVAAIRRARGEWDKGCRHFVVETRFLRRLEDELRTPSIRCSGFRKERGRQTEGWEGSPISQRTKSAADRCKSPWARL